MKERFYNQFAKTEAHYVEQNMSYLKRKLPGHKATRDRVWCRLMGLLETWDITNVQ